MVRMTGLEAIRVSMNSFIYKAFRHMNTIFVPIPKTLFLIHPAIFTLPRIICLSKIYKFIQL